MLGSHGCQESPSDMNFEAHLTLVRNPSETHKDKENKLNMIVAAEQMEMHYYYYYVQN